MRITSALSFVLPLLTTAPGRPEPRPMAQANDNARSAGVLRNGVLDVRLYGQRAQWHPADERGPPIPADAFGEEGKAPSMPGPLLRAKVGTRVQITLRNAFPETLIVHGLRE